MTNLKYSRQREAIKQYLDGRTDHPTADDIYTSLREDFPNISLGTVYRNLALLTNLGEIAKISADSGADHYDADIAQHLHFICSRCHKVSDIHTAKMPSILDIAAEHCSGRIESCQAVFYGICEDCMENA